MLPATYRKLVATAHSRDVRSVARIVEVPLRDPGPGEVLIRNRFAGVNASDVNLTSGAYGLGAPPPFDLGVEAVGEVVAVGGGVDALAPGSAVLTLTRGGGYREYLTVPAAQAFPVPRACPEVLAVGLSGLTAAVGLSEVGQLGRGETVLVTAAAGATGSFAVQLAKRADSRVIATCGGPDKAARLRALGCDRVVDYRREDLDRVLRDEYPGGLDLVYEGVGGALFDVAVDHLAVRGRLLIVGYISEYATGARPVCQPRIYERLLWKSAQLRAFLLSHYPEAIRRLLPELLQREARGELEAWLDGGRYRGLEAVCDALEALHAGRNTGKVYVAL